MSERFDAFISYARTSSTEGARAIKRGLEQYNRRWNSPRSTTVFRDDSSMSGAASLEETITTSLAGSRWLIVLLSEAAAQSPWVAKEVAWWLTNRDPSTLLLVHVDGHLAWANGDFTPDSTAVPPSLRGALAYEPRWIDMRWFSEVGEADAQLKDPRLEDVVIQLYCPIHGVDREDAVAQNSAQVRRARRLARGAIVLLSTLLVVSLVAGGVALQQRNNAIEQSHRAIAKQLAAQSQQILTSDINLSRLFAAQAYSMLQDEQTRGALLSSVTATSQAQGQVSVDGLVRSLAASSDGQTLVFGMEDGRVVRWDRATGGLFELGTVGSRASRVATSKDGRVVVASTSKGMEHQTIAAWVGDSSVPVPSSAAGIAVAPSGGSLVVSASEGGAPSLTLMGLNESGAVTSTDQIAVLASGALAMPDDRSVVILDGVRARRIDLDTGEQTGDVRTPCSGPSVYEGILSPSGTTLLCESFLVRTDVVDSDGYSAREVPLVGGGYHDSVLRAVADDGSRVVVAEGDQIQVLRPGQMSNGGEIEVVLRGSPTISALMVNGSTVVAADQSRVNVFDLDRPQPLSTSGEFEFATYPCPDCSLSEVSLNDDGSAAVVSQQNSLSGVAFGMTIVARDGTAEPIIPDRRFLDWRDTNRFFAVTPGLIELYGLESTEPLASWPVEIGGESDVSAVLQGHWSEDLGRLQLVGSNGSLTTLDPESGEVRDQKTIGNLWAISPDGTRLLSLDQTSTPYGIGVWDAVSGEQLEVDAGAGEDLSSLQFTGDHELKFGVRESFVIPNLGVRPALAANTGAMRHGPEVSPNGELFLTAPDPGRLVVNSRTTGKPLADFSYAASDFGEVRVAFSGDSRSAVAISPMSDEDGALLFGRSTLAFYDLDPNHWYAEACRTVGRALTPEEWRQEVGSDPTVPLVCGDDDELMAAYPAPSSGDVAVVATSDPSPVSEPGDTTETDAGGEVETPDEVSSPPAGPQDGGTEVIVVSPVSQGAIDPEYSISDEYPDPVDCSDGLSSPAGVTANTYRCGFNALQAVACVEDPAMESSILCLEDGWGRELRRFSVTGLGPTPITDEPEPLNVELVDGSRWYMRVGGGWSPTPEGTFPVYACRDGCVGEQVLVLTEDGPAIDTSTPLWTAHIALMGDPSALPPPVQVEVARAWFIAAD